jgi:CxxC motif-containing protein (DUF1111 family)
MRAAEASLRAKRSCKVGLWLGIAAALGGWCAAARADLGARQGLEEGRELFLREWTPGDSRSHGGDGLGPVYNDTSCVACHNAGGPGGGGPKSKNVDIISAFPTRGGMPTTMVESSSFLRSTLTALTGIDPPNPRKPAPPRKPDARALIHAHPGFRTARSVVLHRFGIDPNYEGWRRSMSGLGPFVTETRAGFNLNLNAAQAEIDQIKTFVQFGDNTQFQPNQALGDFTVLRSQRNPTALFGAGQIDAIPDEVLEAAACVKHAGRPEIAGRVSRQKDGRIGRFGWKAQTPRLDDFVRTACAVELGLDVPGRHQGGLPQKPDAKPAGLDLTDQECGSLLAFVASLPKPVQAMPSSAFEQETVAAGRALFDRVGCTSCHTPNLGTVEGIYGDLLLHDMGPDTGDTGAYGAFVPNSAEPDVIDSDSPVEASVPVAVETPFPAPAPTETPQQHAFAPVRPTGPATRQEWRTPPLWGFRDSGPYLHDGRAATLEEAIALHGGEAANSAREFFHLKLKERQQVASFLKTLVAPGADAGQ